MDRHHLAPELYVLILKFLENGPCSNIAKGLAKKLEDHDLLPPRYGLEGSRLPASSTASAFEFRDVAPDHLLRLCANSIRLHDQSQKAPLKDTCTLLGRREYSLVGEAPHREWSSRRGIPSRLGFFARLVTKED